MKLLLEYVDSWLFFFTLLCPILLSLVEYEVRPFDFCPVFAIRNFCCLLDWTPLLRRCYFNQLWKSWAIESDRVRSRSDGTIVIMLLSRSFVDSIPVDLQWRVWILVVFGYQVNVPWREVCFQIFDSRLGGVWCHVTLFITCDFNLIKFSLLTFVD